MNNHVTEMAAEVGLSYHMDTAVVANSFNAHQFTHLAKKTRPWRCRRRGPF
jgi:predicted DsbA family dithiol-disulfide isomerase